MPLNDAALARAGLIDISFRNVILRITINDKLTDLITGTKEGLTCRRDLVYKWRIKSKVTTR